MRLWQLFWFTLFESGIVFGTTHFPKQEEDLMRKNNDATTGETSYQSPFESFAKYFEPENHIMDTRRIQERSTDVEINKDKDKKQDTVKRLLFARAENETETIPEVVREKRQGESRTINIVMWNKDVGPGVGAGGAPLCFEREVYGTCRYRTAPDECFRHEWTAYATIINIGYKKITTIPEGLVVYPGAHARARVFLKSSCCNPIVQFLAHDLFLQVDACIVDVRELQDLHPGEIAGIVVGVLLFIIIIIVVVALCIRRQRQKKLEKETVIFGRSLTRSKSRSENTTHR